VVKKFTRLLKKLSQNYEIVIVLAVVISVYILAFHEDILERFHDFPHEYSFLQRDETIILLTIFSLVLGFFYYNKWKELKKEFNSKKEIEANLRNSQKQYKELFENAHDAIIILKLEGEVVLNVNERACEIYGYTRSEFIGMSLTSISISTSGKEEHIQDTLEKGFYHSFETVQLRADGTEMYLEINASVINYEDQPAILSINRDVTKRRIIEKAYKESEAKLKAIVKNSSDIIFIFDKDLKYKFISPAFENITGYKIEEKLNKYLLDDIHPEDQRKLLDLLDERNEGKISGPTLIELRYKRKDGEYIYSESIAMSKIDEPEISGIIVNARDITERKKVEKDLLLYSHAIRNISDGIIITDLDNKITFVNEAFTKIYGYTYEEVIDKDASMLSYYEEKLFESITKNTITHGWRGELLNRRKDGTVFPIELTTSAIVDEKDETIGLIGIFKDISERKQAEEQLKNSEQKYRFLAENSTDFIYVYNLVPEPHYQYISPSCEQITGYTPEEGYADPFIYHNKLVTSEYVEKFNEYLFSPDAEKQPIREKWKRKDGTEIWVEQVISRNFDENGKLISFQSTVRDVTERELTEKALRESETRFRSLYENTTLGLFRFNVQGDVLLANPAFLGILGYDSFSEVSKLNLEKSQVYVDDIKRKEFRQIIELEEIINGFEVEWFKKDKSIIYVRLNGRAVKSNNKIEYFECTLEDITERMKAEIAQQKSELLLETTQSLSKVGGWEFDIMANSLTWTLETYRIHDLDPSDKISNLDKFTKIIGPLHSPQDFPKVKKAVTECITKGTPFDLEIQLTTLKGRKLWVRSTGEPVRENNKIVKVIGNIMDITSQKSAEEKLRDSERRFKSLYENATIGIFRTTPKGNILLANPAFANLLGYDTEEELKAINVERDRVYFNKTRRKEFKFEIESNEVVTGFEAKWYKKDGSIIYVLINGRAFRDSKGNVIYYDGTIENITERKEAEEKLKNSELKYRTVADWTYDWEYWLASNNEVNYMSPSVEAITGFKVNEFITNPSLIDEIVLEEDRAKVRQEKENFEENNSGSEPFTTEFRILTKDSQIRWISHLERKIFGSTGEYLGIRASNRDITDGKKSLELITRLSTVIEQSPLTIIITDSEGIIEYINPTGINISGYTSEEIIGKTPRVFNSGKTKKQTYDKLWTTIKSGNTWTGELLNRKKNGEFIWENVLISPIYDTLGNLSNFVSVREDVTEKKKNEKELAKYRDHLEELVEERTAELKQSEEKYRILAENSEDVVIRYDKNLTIIYINQVIERYFDINYEEIIGKNIFDTKLPLEVNNLLSETLQNVFRTGNQSRIEFKVNNNWVDYIAVPELNLEGEVYSIVASARDITKIKESERKINEALQKEKELNEFKSKFIATASHQFRTPLASILSSSQMIKRYSKKWDENKINKHHSRINDSITNLTQLMDDLLTIGKIEQGRYDIRYEEINLANLINKLINEVESKDQEETRIKFINTSNHKLLKTDKKIFSEIVNNLLTNALKYSPSNQFVFAKLSDTKHQIKISIKDHGIGISKDDQKYIFNSFFRGKNGLDVQGTGLGLSIVKRGIDLLQGNIEIKSDLDKGTEIIIKLPLEQQKVAYEKDIIS